MENINTYCITCTSSPQLNYRDFFEGQSRFNSQCPAQSLINTEQQSTNKLAWNKLLY